MDFLVTRSTRTLTQHSVIFRPTGNRNFENSLFFMEFDIPKLDVIVVVSLSPTVSRIDRIEIDRIEIDCNQDEAKSDRPKKPVE
jgi:hypothetical protein